MNESTAAESARTDRQRRAIGRRLEVSRGEW
jgi:hypothetical protein